MEKNNRWQSVLSETTLIPISFVIVLLTSAYWIFHIESSAQMTAVSFQEYRAAQDATTDRFRERLKLQDSVLNDVQRKLERIDAKVDFIYETAKRSR